jgi:hypothetical protein
MDTNILWVRAESCIRAGRWGDALRHLRPLIEVVDRIDFEYEEWLRATAEALRATGRDADASACTAYLSAVDPPSPRTLTKYREAIEGGNEAARLRVAEMAIFLSHGNKHRVAAHWFDAAHMPVHQAIALERAGDDEEAAKLWLALIESERLSENPYEHALARINYGLCLARLRADGARAAIGAGTRAVEEVADRFESEGMRERAFDCYQLLARVGIETKAFENVAEGLLNSVRILRDDALKLDALRLYEAFAALAEKFGEYHAVATVLREAAEYCGRCGLPYADDLRLRAGDAWVRTARAAADAGHPAQIIENAYLSAAEAYVAVRAFRKAAGVYELLSQLELKGGQRYARLLERLGPVASEGPRPTPVPEFLKRLPDYEEVWYVDLAEWELAGNPRLVAAGILADRRFPDFVRRHALLLVLEAWEAQGEESTINTVTRLHSIRAYPVIAALESLYERGNLEVRVKVVEALGSLRFKRSFTTVIRALRAEQLELRKAARKSLERLFFPHAFDRLRSVFEARDMPEAGAVRTCALKAIGRINTAEALEFLCDRLREDDPELVQHAVVAVGDLSNAELLPYLREQIDMVPPRHRTLVEDVVARLTQRAR